MLDLLRSDPEIPKSVNYHLFSYSTPKLSINPARRIPDIDTIAGALRTFLEVSLSNSTPLLFVTHSQGGLIVQRYLAQELSAGQGLALQRVRHILMYACPNAGSEFFLAARGSMGVWRHAQEKELRPINSAITSTLRHVLRSVVYADRATPSESPIPITAVVGSNDNIVAQASAASVFPDIAIVPGDHFSVIKPANSSDARYVIAHKAILDATTRNSNVPLNPKIRRSTTPVKEAAPAPSSNSDLYTMKVIVEALLAIRELSNENHRREVLSFLPPYLIETLRQDQPARLVLMSLVRNCDRFGEAARLALLETVEIACPPQDPAVPHALSVMRESWQLPTHEIA